MARFLKGLDLCESFFNEIARPVLETKFAEIPYSSALIGYGSDVIGFDDEMSTDHQWGPRFQLFLPEEGFTDLKERISSAFALGFPYLYKDFSTNFSAPDWSDNGVRCQQIIAEGPIDPLVEFHTIRSFFVDYLGYVPVNEIPVHQWLTFTEHRLLGATSGRVFHDELGLNLARQNLEYFPRDVWLWMIAAQWTMISDEEAFPGRCGIVGDDLGSRLVAARQIQRLMRLGFLMEKRYAPYSKWFGSAYRKLEIASVLLPILEKVTQAAHWKERDEYLAKAYSIMADKHNSLGIAVGLSSQTRNYFGRPFQVLFAERFAEAARNAIQSHELKQLVPLIGSVSQFTDSTALLDNVHLYRKLSSLYL
jgi:hypothetical protein